MADDNTRIEGELDNILSILQGHDTSSDLISVNVHNRQELAITKKFDLQPKASTSGINDYITKNKITADMIRDIDVATRQDGMLSIVLVWGRTHPTMIAGPIGPQGEDGEAGDPGKPGKDAQCDCGTSECYPCVYVVGTVYGETYTFPDAPDNSHLWGIDFGGYSTLEGTGNIGTITINDDIFPAEVDPEDPLQAFPTVAIYYCAQTRDIEAPVTGTPQQNFAYVADNTQSPGQLAAFQDIASIVGEDPEEKGWDYIYEKYNDYYLNSYDNMVLPPAVPLSSSSSEALSSSSSANPSSSSAAVSSSSSTAPSSSSATPSSSSAAPTSIEIPYATTVLLLHAEDMTDDSPSNHTLTPTSNVTAGEPAGKFGLCFRFPGGSTEKLTVSGNTNDWNFGSNNFAIGGFFFLNSFTGTIELLCQMGADWGWQFRIDSGNFAFYYGLTSTTYQYVSFGTPGLAIQTWHHIGVARSGDNLRLYINGNQQGSTFDMDGDSIFGTTGQNLTVGNYVNNNLPMNGHQDEVVIMKGTDNGWNGVTIDVPSLPYTVAAP